MSDARTTLEVVLKAIGFTEGGAAIKKLGDEATTTNAKLKTTATTVDQAAKSSATLGSKLKNAGSQFAGTITSVAALGSTIVNLSRQYQDLGDTQIAVEKAQRKVSVAHEAVAKATAALNSALAKYGKGSKQAQQAALDLNQAQSQLSISTQLLTERTEDHQRAQENFWMGVVPTILTAGTSMISMFKEMGGESGIGGLGAKLKGLSGSAGGIKNLALAFGPIAIAAAAATVAVVELIGQMDRAAKSKVFDKLGTKATLPQLQDQMKIVEQQSGSWGDQLFRGLKVAFSFDSIDKKKEIIDFWPNVMKSLEQRANRIEAVTLWKTVLENVMGSKIDPVMKSSIKGKVESIIATLQNEFNFTARSGVTAQQTTDFTMNFLGPLMEGVSADIRRGAVDAQIALNVKEFQDRFVQGFTGATATAQLTASTGGGGLINEIVKKMMGEKITVDTAPLDAAWKTWSIDAQKSAMETMDQVFKTTQDAGVSAHTFISAAAKQTAADEKAAALETQQAWDKAFGVQVSALDKIFAAYHKLHPGGSIDTKKGTRTFAPGQLPTDIAQKAFEGFESGLAHIVTSPASAKTYAQNWITTAAGHMKGIAGKLLTPITEYIQAHRNDAPDVFLDGLKTVIEGYDATKTFQTLMQPAITVAGETGTATAGAISTGLGKVDVTPLEEKMKLGAEAAGLVTKGINKIPKKVTSTVNITANLAQANAKWQAFARKVQGTTLQVKIAGTSVNIRKGSQAGAYGGPHAAGWNTTVKRPTMFMAGEGGRQEDVYIKPKGSAGQGPSGGGFNGTINVYVDGVLRPARYDMGARK